MFVSDEPVTSWTELVRSCTDRGETDRALAAQEHALYAESDLRASVEYAKAQGKHIVAAVHAADILEMLETIQMLRGESPS